jgi:hypothetical protein
MAAKLELTGTRFGRLVAVEIADRQNGHVMWRCKCDCGEVKVASANNLRRGLIKSCGCYRQEVGGNKLRTHGASRSPTYASWRAMIQRCENTSSPSYAAYGAKGVTMAPAWHVFENFLRDMGERPAGKSLDRFPNCAGNYEPGNCRWATAREQRMNQARGTITFEQAEEVRRLRVETRWGQNTIAKHLGISPGAVSGVIWLGNLTAAR